MRDVHVAGAGVTTFGKFPSMSVADIGWPAVKAAIDDVGMEGRRTQEAHCGTVLGGMLAGQRILARIGLRGIPTTNIENAGSSSSTALHQAVIAVRSGMDEVVLVIGVENLSKYGGHASLQEEHYSCNGRPDRRESSDGVNHGFPPELGQHTVIVLAEILGLDQDHIDDLINRGIVSRLRVA